MIAEYSTIRSYTEKLCAPLKIEDYIPQPVPFISPPKWHLAHTTWFFEEMVLKKYLKGYKQFHPDFGFLFNSYYNSVGTRTLRADRGNMTRPTVEEVYAYRRYVDDAMKELLKQPISPSLKELVVLGLNHEQQHQELLLTDLKYILGHNPLFPVYKNDFNLCDRKNDRKGWLTIAEGVYEIGFNGDGFCYDNELGRHKVFLNEFTIAEGLVTNADFIEFIEAGGYETFSFWLDEGWTWLQENSVNSPLYWHKIGGIWHQYTLAGLKKVAPEQIVTHLSFYEAAAFALWKGMRLATEFEWEIASNKMQWGKRWEWTGSAYLPYPNFNIAEGAVGEYNGKFMINQMVLRGASTATSPKHSRITYRNFFHAEARWQYSGIRLVK